MDIGNLVNCKYPYHVVIDVRIPLALQALFGRWRAGPHHGKTLCPDTSCTASPIRTHSSSMVRDKARLDTVRIPLALQALFGPNTAKIAFHFSRIVRIPLALQALFGPLVRMLVDAE